MYPRRDEVVNGPKGVERKDEQRQIITQTQKGGKERTGLCTNCVEGIVLLEWESVANMLCVVFVVSWSC